MVFHDIIIFFDIAIENFQYFLILIFTGHSILNFFVWIILLFDDLIFTKSIFTITL